MIISSLDDIFAAFEEYEASADATGDPSWDVSQRLPSAGDIALMAVWALRWRELGATDETIVRLVGFPCLEAAKRAVRMAQARRPASRLRAS